jgi:glyoxylase-like metal-dependent hydrolase (beta-lactamase superfamily II)
MAGDRGQRRFAKHSLTRTYVLVLALVCGVQGQVRAAVLHVDVYRGGFASVNSFIVSNGHSQIVIDAQRKSSEARKLAELVRAKHLPLTHIFITHGHTDHFTGMAYLHEQFPEAHIVAASEAIKREIKDYAIYMDSGGETGAEPALEPALRPKSARNPAGFDYEGLIQVLAGHTLTLDGGGVLEITDEYPPTESLHTATLFSRDLNALFLADLGYNKVHLWMGDDITLARVGAWRAELVKLKARYAPLNPKIFPGHGAPTDKGMFDEMIRYIEDYTRIVSSVCAPEQAMQKMKDLYPRYEQADFFLKYSAENHVKGCERRGATAR